MVMTDDEKLEFQKRTIHMNEVAERIAATDSGLRFLDRVNKIGKPRPLHEEPEQEGES